MDPSDSRVPIGVVGVAPSIMGISVQYSYLEGNSTEGYAVYTGVANSNEVETFCYVRIHLLYV